MRKNILHVLQYFDQFEYPPTRDEIFRYLPLRSSYKDVSSCIDLLEKDKSVFVQGDRVTLEKKNFKVYDARLSRSAELLSELARIRPLLQLIPLIELIGISGSLSMNNNKKDDDIDLFVITKASSLWQSRFLLLIAKKIFILMGQPAGSKMCLNLFFSHDNLILPDEKHSEYTAHEVLQMKPFLNNNQTYEHFIYKNRWISHFCPNVQISKVAMKVKEEPIAEGKLSLFLEKNAGKIQKWWLGRKGISFCQKNGQLWFIQDDMEKHLKKKVKVMQRYPL